MDGGTGERHRGSTPTMTERQLSEAARVLARMDDVIDTAINAGRREYE